VPMAQFQNATRTHTSFLAPLEKRVLIWMAERLPGWMNSDHLTALGFLSLIGAGLAYWQSRSSAAWLLVVIAFLVLNWFGDSLDGTLARVRNCQRPRYGFYIDHILDACGSMFLLGGLAFSGYMSERVAAGLLVAYLLLSIEVHLATYTLGHFHLSFWKFGPTELRLLLMIGNIALLAHPMATIAGKTYLLFDVGGIIGIAAMAAVLIQAIVKHTVHLYRAETVAE